MVINDPNLMIWLTVEVKFTRCLSSFFFFPCILFFTDFSSSTHVNDSLYSVLYTLYAVDYTLNSLRCIEYTVYSDINCY